MKIPSNLPLPLGNGERFCGEVPCDGLLNIKSSLLPSELKHLRESHQKMDDLSATDWENLSKYRKIYNREQQAKQALSMLENQKDAPNYGFRINNYRHCLLSDTMV